MKKIVFILSIIVLLSCKKKEEPQPAPQPTQPVVYGCMRQGATNYNPQATSDNCASCQCYWTVQ